jgi:hypothetical protein
MTSHRRTQLQRSLAAGLAATALAAPAAHAAPNIEPSTGDAPASTEQGSGPPAVTTIDEGFDWGSAAIGAGGAGALIVLVSLGGFTYASRERARLAP